MKIEKQYYSYSEFTIPDVFKMVCVNGCQITSNGAILSFESPVHLSINDVPVVVPKSFNVCYMFPIRSTVDIAEFNFLMNYEMSKEFGSEDLSKNPVAEYTLIFSGNGLCGGSFFKSNGVIGAGWHTMFTEVPTVQVPGVEFACAPVPEDPEKLKEFMENIHERMELRYNTLFSKINSTTMVCSVDFEKGERQ